MTCQAISATLNHRFFSQLAPYDVSSNPPGPRGWWGVHTLGAVRRCRVLTVPRAGDAAPGPASPRAAAAAPGFVHVVQCVVRGDGTAGGRLWQILPAHTTSTRMFFPRFLFKVVWILMTCQVTSARSIDRIVIQRIFNPRLLMYMASYDVASNVCRALAGGAGRGEPAHCA
jgi:hypothetical protein